jgi:hypothetical protein
VVGSVPSDASAQALSSIVDVLRDQVAAQQDTANTNEFSSNGLMAASLAMIVALMILRATSRSDGISYWWWYPLPLFVVGAALLSVPAIPKWFPTLKDGPIIPILMADFEATPHTQSQIYVRLIQDLYDTWRINDRRLRVARLWVRIGLYVLVGASLISVGLYSWALS